MATTKFVVADEFAVGDHSGFKVDCVDAGFKTLFGNRVEEPTVGSELVVRQLTRDMSDGEIIAELCGGGKAEITLSELHALLVAQGEGQKGPLLTNSYANIAYIGGTSSLSSVLGARWIVDGWQFFVVPVMRSGKWVAGCQVVRRK